MLRVGLIEPHLLRVGGIRRLVEFANRLVDRGHEVTFYLPEGARLTCDWLPCRARITAIHGPVADPLDVVVFNDEPQWYLLSLFENCARVFYALSYARLYRKPGSWEALRADVDLQLANSTWTAEMIEHEIGERPPVVLGGISPEYFHPVAVPKKYPILCAGDKRPWKGSHTIEEAARILDLPLERYAGKNLAQTEMAEEYGRAEVFVVGSPLEGFGQPGLEALACGVPLVTTDNGGCREYAFHEETALVVPPSDPRAMAEAIARVRDDPDLAARLVANGLELVRTTFDWERATDAFEQHLVQAVANAEPRPGRPARVRRPVPERPVLSVVSLVWNELWATQRFVESVRQHTDVPYELILVDNGSDWRPATYVAAAGDSALRNETNLGFAVGMNQGLAQARGEIVAFCNNDTVLPPGWAPPLIEHLRDERVGIVVPAITKANLARTVRESPGDTVERLDPFEAPPPAVVYLLRTATARDLGGFSEEYELASGEDTDLAFTAWVNGLDLVYDSRVLVEHRAKGTARNLDDWEALWRRNRERFLEKWTSEKPAVPRLERCPPEEFDSRLAVARSVAGWMKGYFSTREKLRELQQRTPTIRVRSRRVLATVVRAVLGKERSARFARRYRAATGRAGG